MYKLIKALRDKLTPNSKGYEWDRLRNNYSIYKDAFTKKYGCITNNIYNPDMPYFESYRDGEVVAKMLNKIEKVAENYLIDSEEKKGSEKHPIASAEENSIKDLKHQDNRKKIKVKINFGERIRDNKINITKVHYKLFVDGFKLEGDTIKTFNGNKYSDEYMVTDILLNMIDLYSTALEFNNFRKAKDIDRFQSCFGYTKCSELIQTITEIKKIAKKIKKLKLSREELDEFSKLYSDGDPTEFSNILPILEDKYFNLKYHGC